jgi:hypothetical protein
LLLLIIYSFILNTKNGDVPILNFCPTKREYFSPRSREKYSPLLLIGSSSRLTALARLLLSGIYLHFLPARSYYICRLLPTPAEVQEWCRCKEAGNLAIEAYLPYAD